MDSDPKTTWLDAKKAHVNGLVKAPLKRDINLVTYVLRGRPIPHRLWGAHLWLIQLTLHTLRPISLSSNLTFIGMISAIEFMKIKEKWKMLEARWRSIHFSRAWYFGGPSYIFRAPSSYNLDRNLHVDPTKKKKKFPQQEEWGMRCLNHGRRKFHPQCSRGTHKG